MSAWTRLQPATFTDLCLQEIQGEARLQKLVKLEGAIFVPLSLVDLCFTLVWRLATLEDAFWTGISRHQVPEAIADQFRSFKAAPRRKYPYKVVPMRSVPQEEIRLFAFPTHPAKLARPSLWFSVDLVQGIVDYLRVLAEVSTRKELSTTSNVAAAIERYRRHLERITLLRKKDPTLGPEELPRAGLEVEMVWLAHLIRTKSYREVCRLNFGEIVDHRLPRTSDGPQTTGEETAGWRRIQVDLARAPAGTKDGMGVDILAHEVIKDQSWLAQFVADAARARARSETGQQGALSPSADGQQGTGDKTKETIDWFCALLERPDDSGAMSTLANRILLGYERMIYLMARYPHRVKEFSPPFLVDLVWHVHQVHPVAYVRDMKRVAGVVFDHRPWPVAPSNGNGLSAKSSLELWKLEFSEASFLECELTHFLRT